MSLDVAMVTGGPTLPQERRLVTAIPGPRSLELQERRTQAVSAGWWPWTATP
jgi:4-aminobutyrate aminotransferase/(S)-3-amino-2-methylpropionate transaminase